MNHNGGPNGSRIGSPGQKDSWNDPSGPIQAFNIRSPRKVDEVASAQKKVTKNEPEVTNAIADEARRRWESLSAPGRMIRRLGFIGLMAAAGVTLVVAGGKANQAVPQTEAIEVTEDDIESRVEGLYPDASVEVAGDYLTIHPNKGSRIGDFGENGATYNFTLDNEANASIQGVAVKNGEMISNDDGAVLGRVEKAETVQEAVNDLMGQANKNN